MNLSHGRLAVFVDRPVHLAVLGSLVNKHTAAGKVNGPKVAKFLDR